jgi:hypothetical protein
VWVSRSVRIIEDVKRTSPSDNSPEPEAEVKTENHEDVSPLISVRRRLPSEEDATHLDVGDSHSKPVIYNHSQIPQNRKKKQLVVQKGRTRAYQP